jgi:protein SCO1/2
MTNQTGEEFKSESLNNQVYAIYFFFSTCPTICREFNQRIEQLNSRMAKDDIRFVGISVKPEVDTPEVLARYAQDFGATAPRWQMLTGPMHRVKELGEYGLRERIDTGGHTESIFLVDRWGRYRDRFRWDDAEENKRFVETARKLVDEKTVPLDATITTRNALAATRPGNWNDVPWLYEFELADQNGQKLFSRDLTGSVWVGSFFFSRCPDVCQRQNQYLAALVKRTENLAFPILSISTDGEFDTSQVLREYSAKFGADPERWHFLTGTSKFVRRVSAEFFKAAAGSDHHSTLLFVVDRWQRVRGSFDWQKPEDEAAMLDLIRKLKLEQSPEPIEAAAKKESE